jgi:hypothetical protein
MVRFRLGSLLGSLAAFAGCSTESLVEPPRPDASSDAQPADAISNVKSLDEAFLCRSTNGVGGIGKGTDLTRFNISQTEFPAARCNDGSAPAFYFRPAATSEARNRWVIQLNGGGGCRSADACAARFCGYDTNFSAFQMSSREAPDGTHGEGILARRADNPVGDFNHVFVHYCTSDNWSGQAPDTILSAPSPGAEGPPIAYRIHFAGAHVVDAVVATLRRQTAVPFSPDAPDLDDATQVVFAGASAGGGGVARHADALRATLGVSRPVCGEAPCPLDFLALIDSAFGPDLVDFDLSSSKLCAAGLCSWESIMRNEQTQGGHAIWKARTDQSCLDWHAANDVEKAWQCVDNNYVMANHITSPLLVRTGQTDELQFGNAVEAGFLAKDGSPLSDKAFAAMVRARLAALGNAKSSAAEGSLMSKNPAVFGPSCKKHETLRNNEHTFDVRVRTGAKDVSMFDVFTNFGSGQTPTVAIAQPGDPAACPK